MVSSSPPKKTVIADKLNKDFCETLEIIREKHIKEKHIKEISHVSIISGRPSSNQDKQQKQENTISKTALKVLSCPTPSPPNAKTLIITSQKNSRKRPLSQPSDDTHGTDFVEAKKKPKHVTSSIDDNNDDVITKGLSELDDTLDCADIIEVKYVSGNRAKQQPDALLKNNDNNKRNLKETKLTQFYSGVKTVHTTGACEKARRKRAVGLTRVVKTNHKISEWLNLQPKPEEEVTPTEKQIMPTKKQITPNDKTDALFSSFSPPLSSQSRPAMSPSSSIFMSSYTALSSFLKGRPGIRQTGNESLRTKESMDTNCSWWQQKDVPSTSNSLK